MQKDGRYGWTKDVGRGQLELSGPQKSVHCQQLAPGQDQSTKITKKIKQSRGSLAWKHFSSWFYPVQGSSFSF